MAERWFLAQDDSCHWYCIPVSKSAEWWKWQEDIQAYWDEPDDFVAEPELPEGVWRLSGSPSCLSFSDPLEDLF